MTSNETNVLRAARDASRYSERHLKRAREELQTARKQFDGTFWRAVPRIAGKGVGEHLARSDHKAGVAYSGLMKALDDAERVLVEALSACSRMENAARR